MASSTALGILFYFGLRNSSIISLSPFLILAIGVDDAFLMIHAWQNLPIEGIYFKTDSVTKKISKRIAYVGKELNIIF